MASTEERKNENASEQSKPEQVESNQPESSKRAPPQDQNDVKASTQAEDREVNDLSSKVTAETAEPQQDQDHDKQQEEQQESAASYKWCKCFFDPGQPGVQNFYFLHFETRETKYEEPNEPYWIWDALTNNVHPCGLQYPSITQSSQPAPGTSSAQQSSEPGASYQGYNPKIHGSYDPNADYARFHEQNTDAEAALADYNTAALAAQTGDYSSTGAFNRFTGRFQNAEQSTDRHNDFNKSGRQMNAFFDVDAAANSHDGKSLKEERRGQKLSKKEIKELNKKRREKKEKKRMDFYRA